MRTVLSALLLANLAVTLPQLSPAPAAAQADVREADAAWARAVAAKSVEQTVAFYDAEAVTAGSAMFPAQGLAAFRTQWQRQFAQPAFALTWTLQRVVLLESGTIAYSSGTWTMGTTQGPYLAVWRKQPDGRWKVLVDAAWVMPATPK